jgi:prepilin-type N-terminal cleavage/methylation domain-containing protein
MKQHPSHSAGFTLIELMVSIAIALLLILGVNQVFRISSQTAGAGQALSTINRDNRAIQNTFVLDFKNLLPVASTASPTADGPCFIISSQSVFAFRNSTDKAGAADPADPSHEPNLFANYPGNKWPAALINFRNHRIDTVSFFTRGLYARQSASGNAGFVSSTTATEAWIWYGDGALAGNNGTVYGPGGNDPTMPPDSANTNNQVASDFFLCRQAILLNSGLSTSPAITPPRDANFYIVAPSVPMSPLGFKSPANGDPQSLIQFSRYDIAQTSIQGFTNILKAYAGPTGAVNDWWDPMIYRFQINPFVSKPITAAGMATSSPALVRGCAQFIVEYAGNFYTKNQYGGVVNASPDPTGQLDFSVDTDSTGRVIAQRTRWYGFPRDTNGDGIIDSRDVMPLREYIDGVAAADGTTIISDDIEKFSNLLSPGKPYNSAGTPSTGFDYKPSVSRTSSYTAAWGPRTNTPFPKMVRITVAIDDPNGRLGDAQFFEYVFDVQP